MKRQALDHTKMDLLMRKLRLPRWGCVGILESLWHLTAKEAPRGDIGKLSDERIAIGIDWRGAKNRDAKSEASRLIRALVESGWLDAAPEWDKVEAEQSKVEAERGTNGVPMKYQWRLVVHDWQEHADDSVKRYLKRNGLCFACLDMSGTCRDMERLPVPEPVPVPVPAPVTASEWPLTTAAFRKRAASADQFFVLRVVQESVQAAISARKDCPAITDAVMAAAVEKACAENSKAGSGLLLKLVPQVIGTWAIQEGSPLLPRLPPQSKGWDPEWWKHEGGEAR